MWKRVLGVLALSFCAACTEAGLRAGQLGLGGSPQRIAGTGDLSQPLFAGGSGSFLTVTDGGQPRMVFVVSAVTLEVEPVSFRPPPPGVPATPTAIGEVVRDLLVIPNDDSFTGSVSGTATRAAFLSQASNLLDPGTGVLFFRDSTQAFAKDLASGENFLVSMGADGYPANSDVTSAVMSGSGRFVAFATRATNLYEPMNPSVAPNGASQIYVRDLLTGDLRLISMASSGAPGTGDSTDPVITTDGRFVAFRTEATNLATGLLDLPMDVNLAPDIYVYDRLNMTMELVSVSVSLAGGHVQSYVDPAEPAISQNGNFIAFSAKLLAGGARQVWLRDRAANATVLVSGATPLLSNPTLPDLGDDDSASPSITPDGMMVAFASKATSLDTTVPPDSFWDVFVVNIAAVSPTLLQKSVNVTDMGPRNANGDSTQPTLSPDGTFLAYISTAMNVAPDDPYRQDGDANGLANLIISPQ